MTHMSPTHDARREISINVPAFALSEIPALAKAAETSGFTALRVGDMQSTHRELYCTLTAIAASTERVQFGPGVSNPVTRHPAVAAAAMATLQEFSGGRAVFGVGAGDSAVHNLGARPATVADFEAYLVAIRALHESGRTLYRGAELVLEWWAGGAIPIIISAHGPRMLELAGRIADGVVIGLGTGELAREYADEHITRGARAAGRNPHDIQRWYLTYLNIAESAALAANQVGSALAVGANLLAKSAARTVIPDRLRSGFAELTARYSYLQHAGSSNDNPNARLIVELGLQPYLADAFGVLGDDTDVPKRLDALHGAGVSRLWGAYVRDDLAAFFTRWGAAVPPTRTPAT